MANSDFIGIKRRRIEDRIMAHYDQVDFTVKQRAWLEDARFWDFVFSWYELAKYYDDSTDTAIGAGMLDLYMHCADVLRAAAQDRSLTERRRDKAADALYQINYYVNQIMLSAHRNSHAGDDNDAAGRIDWKR
jgi:hypothetical protein